MITCPECDSEIYGKVCRCGWTPPAPSKAISRSTQERCTWNNGTHRCTLNSRIKDFFNKPYCQWHFLNREDQSGSLDRKLFDFWFVRQEDLAGKDPEKIWAAMNEEVLREAM